MIKTRLIGQVPSSKKYIAFTVLAQWIRLCANIVMMFIFAHILELILGGATNVGRRCSCLISQV